MPMRILYTLSFVRNMDFGGTVILVLYVLLFLEKCKTGNKESKSIWSFFGSWTEFVADGSGPGKYCGECKSGSSHRTHPPIDIYGWNQFDVHLYLTRNDTECE